MAATAHTSENALSITIDGWIAVGVMVLLLLSINLLFKHFRQIKLYTEQINPGTGLWALYIANDIFLQTSIPAETMVVFKFSFVVICISHI